MTQTQSTQQIDDTIPDQDSLRPWAILRSVNPKFQDFVLYQSTCSIGRSHENDIIIDDVRLSKVHCKITRVSPGEYMVQDFSSNGTYLDDEKIGKNQARRLNPGDKLFMLSYVKVPKADIQGFIFSLLEDELANLRSECKENEIKTWGKLSSFNIVLDAITLAENEYTIGREIKGKNPVCIPDNRISGTHCRIFREPNGEIYIEDYSSNGTYLEDVLIGKGKKQKLKSGDKIFLLHTRKVELMETMGFIFSEFCEKPTQIVKRRRHHEEEEEKASVGYDRKNRKQIKQEKSMNSLLEDEEPIGPSTTTWIEKNNHDRLETRRLGSRDNLSVNS